jgi:hypothetical protein
VLLTEATSDGTEAFLDEADAIARLFDTKGLDTGNGLGKFLQSIIVMPLLAICRQSSLQIRYASLGYYSFLAMRVLGRSPMPCQMGKHLSTASCAALNLECLAKEKYPSWDAQKMSSVHLAEKLGYKYSYKDPVYDVN